MTSRRSIEPCAAPGASPGPVSAADFFEKHARPDFLDACYAQAPPRIQRALAEEVAFLRSALGGAKHILEIGCGSGRLLETLCDLEKRWVGVDFVSDFLRMAKDRRRLPPFTVLVGSRGERLPFRSGSFDAVVCAQNTLGLLGEQKLAVIGEAARVTRPGGCAWFVVYSAASVVPRVEWYARLHEQGLMARLDWARSAPELLISEDGHASECFERERLERLFRTAATIPRIQPLGELYWVVQVRKEDSPEEERNDEVLQ